MCFCFTYLLIFLLFFQPDWKNKWNENEKVYTPLQVWECPHLTSRPGAAHKGMFGLYQSTRRKGLKTHDKILLQLSTYRKLRSGTRFREILSRGSEWKKKNEAGRLTDTFFI